MPLVLRAAMLMPPALLVAELVPLLLLAAVLLTVSASSMPLAALVPLARSARRWWRPSQPAMAALVPPHGRPRGSVETQPTPWILLRYLGSCRGWFLLNLGILLWCFGSCRGWLLFSCRGWFLFSLSLLLRCLGSCCG